MKVECSEEQSYATCLRWYSWEMNNHDEWPSVIGGDGY